MRRPCQPHRWVGALLVLMVITAGVSAQDKSEKPASIMVPTEQDLVAEINAARADPQKYAAILEQEKKYFSGNEFHPPQRPGFVTNEGLKAVDEAINFLRSLKPVPTLATVSGMCLAAKDHLKDLQSSGKTGHKGSDGSTTEDRVNRYGNWMESIGENIAYDAPTAREVVIGWIIDDGLASRGHRKHLFDPSYRVVGVALTPLPNSSNMFVATFAGGFSEKSVAAPPASAVQKKK
jgi:hypothetical protein